MSKNGVNNFDSDSNLSDNRELFCKMYVSEEFFGNGVQAYAKAYNKNLDDKKDYKAAKNGASRLLSNMDVCTRISELLDEAGLNDNFVDKQLLFVVTQNADFSSKMKAISEYNKLRSRINTTLNVNHSYEDFDGDNPEDYVKKAISNGQG